MNIIVLSKSRIEGSGIADKLLAGGADRVSVVCSIEQAEKRIKQINACCLCFHRDFVKDPDSFFSYFTNTFLFFIPYSETENDMDVIYGAHTKRIVHYLYGSVEQMSIETAIRNLKQSIVHAGIIYIEPPYRHRAKDTMCAADQSICGKSDAR